MISQNISKSILAIICAVTTAAAAGCSASPAKPGQTTQVEQTAEAEQDDSQTAEAEQDDSLTAEAVQDDSQAAGADWDAGQTAEAAEETPEETEQEDPPIQTIETEAYIEKLVPVYDGQMTDMKVPLRFFKETPNVAYMGIGEYFELMLGGGLEVKPAEGEGDAGKYILTNRSGASAEVDIEKGIMSIEDLPSFLQGQRRALCSDPGSRVSGRSPAGGAGFCELRNCAAQRRQQCGSVVSGFDPGISAVRYRTEYGEL